MNLRDALVTMSPNLELQRGAHAEISRLDTRLAALNSEVDTLRKDNDALQKDQVELLSVLQQLWPYMTLAQKEVVDQVKLS